MTITLVVPTLGQRPELLARSLDSITSQAVDALDLVVVAPTGHGVEELARQAGGRFVPDPGSGGLSGALNAGLHAARPGAAYFSWLGDDDLLSPGSLAATVAAFEQHPDAVLVYGWCDYVDEDDRGACSTAALAGWRRASWRGGPT